MTWVPVDILAQIIVELVSNSMKERPPTSSAPWTEYYHLENPHDAKFSSLIPVIQEYFSKDSLQVVSLGEWVDKLEASGKQPGADTTLNPGLKLLDMFQGLKATNESMVMETKNTRENSKAMQNLPPVNEEWMRLWLQQWAF